MKELVNKFLINLHAIVLIYGLYGAWVMYDEHTLKVEDLDIQNSAANSELESSQKKIKELDEFSKKTDEYKVRLEEVAKNIETVQKQLPSETNDGQILNYLQGEMKALNIKDSSFTPGKEETSTYYISKSYSLKAQGTFLQFLIFFERLGNADRIYNIKNLKISTPNDTQKGRFQIISGEGVIEAFRFNPEFKVERGF